MYVAGGIPLSRSSPHFFTSVEGVHTKPRFVRDEDTSPLNLSPVLVYPGPVETVLLPKWCQKCDNRRCGSAQVDLVEPAADRTGADPWLAYPWSLCGSLCSSTESVAEMLGHDILVLLWSRNFFPSGARPIINRVSFQVPLP